MTPERVFTVLNMNFNVYPSTKQLLLAVNMMSALLKWSPGKPGCDGTVYRSAELTWSINQDIKVSFSH